MAHTSTRGWQPRRALFLMAGLVLAGGVLIHATPAQPPRKDKDKPPIARIDDKIAPRQKAITLPRDATSDVVEMVGLINSKLEESWKENKLTPSAVCSDHEFLRRASIDIIGRIATPKEMEQFENDLKDPSKRPYARSLLIDRLLASLDYPRHWANVWTNWLLSRSGTFGRGKYHEDLATWMEDKFALNRPHHEIVRGLLTASGPSQNTKKGEENVEGNPAVLFILAHVGEAVPQNRRAEDGQFEMVPITSRITRMFLGVQTQCTQCHDHPFDPGLKQDHFWGINAFLRQVGRNGTPPQAGMRRMGGYPMLELVDTNLNKGAVVAFEKRNGVVREIKPTFLDGKRANPEMNRREELARMVVESPNFPRATVNRMWSVFFGKGFCNPVDDFNEQNPVSNPELLKELGEKFKHYGNDMKKLIRWICNSEAYNLSCAANATNDKQEHEVLFSRMLLKAMAPEVLFESLMVATQSSAGKDTRQEQRNNWLDSLVTNFGDDEGNEANFNGSVVQALMMMNGKDINAAIEDKGGAVASAMKKSTVPGIRVNELYRVALNRPVDTVKKDKNGQTELQRVLEKFELRPRFRDKEQQDRYEDLLWGLLNSNEFILNH
jgi:hypothetical protein